MHSNNETETLTLTESFLPQEKSSPLLQEKTTKEEIVNLPSYEIFLFFYCSLGSTLCINAVLSCLVYYDEEFGDMTFTLLNLCFFVPFLPMSIAQSYYDLKYDIFYGSRKAFLFRGLVGFCGSWLILLVPVVSELWILLLLAFLIGISGAIVLGTMFEMASFVAPNGELIVAVSSAIEASGVLVLVVSLITGFGQSEDDNGKFAFFYITFALHFLCFVSFLSLFFVNDIVTSIMEKRDIQLHFHSMLLNEFLLGSSSTIFHETYERFDDEGQKEDEYYNEDRKVDTQTNTNKDNSAKKEENEQENEMSYTEIFKISKLFCLSILISVSSNLCVGSYFGEVNTDTEALPQILFFTRLFSDFLGRPINLCFNVNTTGKKISTWAAMRFLLFVPTFFILAPLDANVDVFLVIIVACLSFTSGFIVTISFKSAHTCLPPEYENGTNLTKQASLLNVFLSSSVILGVVVSLIILALR